MRNKLKLTYIETDIRWQARNVFIYPKAKSLKARNSLVEKETPCMCTVCFLIGHNILALVLFLSRRDRRKEQRMRQREGGGGEGDGREKRLEPETTGEQRRLGGPPLSQRGN